MSKLSKVLLVLTGLALIFVTGLYVYVKAEKPLEIPQSTLVYNVFSAENNKYKETSSLPDTYYCNYIPYTVNVPSGDKAHINDGVVYPANSSSYIYVTEIVSGEDVNVHIMSELPKAIMYDYSSEKSKITEILADNGYINGFSADYFVKGFNIKNALADESASAVVIGYIVKIADYDRDILIAAASTDTSNDSMAACKKVVDTVLYTIRYDRELEEKQIKAAIKAEEEAIANFVPETFGGDDDSDIDDSEGKLFIDENGLYDGYDPDDIDYYDDDSDLDEDEIYDEDEIDNEEE